MWERSQIGDWVCGTPKKYMVLEHEVCDSRFGIIIDFRKYCKNAWKEDKMRAKSPGMLWKSWYLNQNFIVRWVGNLTDEIIFALPYRKGSKCNGKKFINKTWF